MAFGQMELAAAILDIVPHLDAEVATIRIIMQKLADHFGVDFETIRAQKAMIKQLVVSSYDAEPEHDSSADKENQDQQHGHARDTTAAIAVAVKKPAHRSNVISDESDSDSGDDDNESEQSDNASDEDEERGSSENESDSDSDAPPKKTKRVRASRKSTPLPAKKQRVSADSPGFAALKELARAARLLSPRVYTLLKKLESEQEQEEHVRELLRHHGIRFNGRYPQKREIESVRRKTEMARDLEGIDTSLIIDEDTSKRPRRASRSTGVSYADQLINRSDPDDDETGDDEQDKRAGNGVTQADADKPSRARARKRRVNESEDESDAGEGNASDSSEAEF